MFQLTTSVADEVDQLSSTPPSTGSALKRCTSVGVGMQVPQPTNSALITTLSTQKPSIPTDESVTRLQRGTRLLIPVAGMRMRIGLYPPEFPDHAQRSPLAPAPV